MPVCNWPCPAGLATGAATPMRYSPTMFSEIIELRGHIIDSLILPKVLDGILTEGGDFKIIELKIGQKRADQSYARIEISGPTHEELEAIVLRLRDHGAEVTKISEPRAAAPTPPKSAA